MLLYSLNFEELRKLTDEKNWNEISFMFCGISKMLENSGAQGIVLCANTPHKFADDIINTINIPLIHIAEAAAKEISSKKIKKAALLGTKITMEENFFKDKLTAKNIETLIPGEDDRAFIHNSIFNELGKGTFTVQTKERYIRIINELVLHGAEGIILGCTEIPLLIKQKDSIVPIFDTTLIHANAAVEFALT